VPGAGQEDPVRENGSRIGLYNESSLHAAVKRWYAREGDSLEAEIDGYVVDIVRGDLLVEVQTGNFAAIRGKLRVLLAEHRVRLVHPVAQKKWIVRVSPEDGRILARRRSPKKGSVLSLFDEMVYMPDLLTEERFSIDVLLTHQDEIWCDDGRGSWRRKGVSVLDHRLLSVEESIVIEGPDGLLSFLPDDLVRPFTNRSLAKAAGIPTRLACRMTYCFRKIGLAIEVGRQGNARVFDLASRASTA